MSDSPEGAPSSVIRIRPRAAVEISEAAAAYESRRPSLGIEFLEAVDSVIGLLRRHPDAGREVRPRIRRALLTRFPYGVFYTVLSGGVDVLAVVHSRRHPVRWPRRA